MAVGVPGIGAVRIYIRTTANWSNSSLQATISIGGSAGYGVAFSYDSNTLAFSTTTAPNGNVKIYTFSGTWSFQADLVPTNLLPGSGNLGVGGAIKLSGDGNTIIFGNQGESSNTGAAYIFTRSGGVWTERNKLFGSGATASARFGIATSISGDGLTAVVGGSGDGGLGAAWIFRKNELSINPSWSNYGSKIRLIGSAGPLTTRSLAISGDGNTVAVGVSADNSVFIYIKSGSDWIQQGNKITSPADLGASSFGFSVALTTDGNKLIVGATTYLTSLGAVAIFSRSAGVWTQQGVSITNAFGTGGTKSFGWSVAISSDGNTVAFGGPDDNSDIGAAFVYIWNGTAWASQQRFDGISGFSEFGKKVALSADGNILAVGSPSTDNTGGITVFNRYGTTWLQIDPKTTPGTLTLGRSLSISGNGMVIAAGSSGTNGFVNIYTFYTGKWVLQQKTLIVTGFGSTDGLDQGSDVKLSYNGDLLAVGARNYNGTEGCVLIYAANNEGQFEYKKTLLPQTRNNSPGVNFGDILSMSDDGSIVVAGSASNFTIGSTNRTVHIYS
jgi:hypothetical protein